MTHASLFSGIGGFDLAAEWMGWENLFHCEWNPFCQKVLKYHFPNAHSYNDITTSDFTEFRGRVDVLTGGFPCQPFSTAGQRKGTADDRYLWPEMLRAIREVAPRYIVGENVDGIFSWNEGLVFETVCADLENEGYEVATYRIPACATGAPHRRDRWWFVAHCFSGGQGTPGASRSAGSNGSKDNKQPQERRATTKRIERCLEFSCFDSANPDCERKLQQSGIIGEEWRRISHQAGDVANSQSPERQQPRHSRAGRTGFTNGDFYATHTRRSHAQNGLHGQQSTRQAGEYRDSIEGGHRWSEHCIEAATRLCVLDDGLSGRLDAAALSTKPQHAAGKWRKESLKAAGNAIVPQVAHAIFQAIESTMQ